VGQSFPYQARIAVPGAPIRSGPGDAFYITDTVAEGQTVEVYRHRHNGWCAIRPTEESFSWVYGPHLRLLGDSLAEIDKEDVASRIGSRLSSQRNAVQVRLKKGEVVQILGEADDGGQKWYKIAPPAGEFRWIHSSCIRRTDGAPEPPRVENDSAIETTPSKAVIETEPQPLARRVGGLYQPPTKRGQR
jgi:SH3-like domain-containing protein